MHLGASDQMQVFFVSCKTTLLNEHEKNKRGVLLVQDVTKRKFKKKKTKAKPNRGKKQKKNKGRNRTIQTWALKLIRAVKVLQGRVAGRCGVLALQHLSRLRPQGAIVGKGAGRPPLVTGRGIKPIIGKAWEIQYRMGEREGG